MQQKMLYLFITKDKKINIIQLHFSPSLTEENYKDIVYN